MKPILQAIILADKVYEERSGKKIIAGTFNRIQTGPAPTQQVQQPDGTTATVVQGGTDPGCPWAYISLTDVFDGTEVTLHYNDLETNTSQFHVGVKIANQDRLATIEIVVPLPPMRAFTPHPGTFSLDVVWKGEIIGSQRVIVEQVGGKPAEQSGSAS